MVKPSGKKDENPERCPSPAHRLHCCLDDVNPIGNLMNSFEIPDLESEFNRLTDIPLATVPDRLPAPLMDAHAAGIIEDAPAFRWSELTAKDYALLQLQHPGNEQEFCNFLQHHKLSKDDFNKYIVNDPSFQHCVETYAETLKESRLDVTQTAELLVDAWMPEMHRIMMSERTATETKIMLFKTMASVAGKDKGAAQQTHAVGGINVQINLSR